MRLQRCGPDFLPDVQRVQQEMERLEGAMEFLGTQITQLKAARAELQAQKDDVSNRAITLDTAEYAMGKSASWRSPTLKALSG